MPDNDEAEAQAIVDALLVERKPIHDAWQADVFNREKEQALQRFDTRLMLANRRLARAQGVDEYPSDRAYFAEVGETEDDEDDDA